MNFIFFVGAKTQKLKSEIMHILQSHYPPSGNVQVILLKFKMAVNDIRRHAGVLFYIGLHRPGQIQNFEKGRGSDEKSVVLQPEKIHNSKYLNKHIFFGLNFGK